MAARTAAAAAVAPAKTVRQRGPHALLLLSSPELGTHVWHTVYTERDMLGAGYTTWLGMLGCSAAWRGCKSEKRRTVASVRTLSACDLMYVHLCWYNREVSAVHAPCLSRLDTAKQSRQARYSTRTTFFFTFRTHTLGLAAHPLLLQGPICIHEADGPYAFHSLRSAPCPSRASRAGVIPVGVHPTP